MGQSILKQTPITFNGIDGFEVLIKDDDVHFDEVFVCERCMYFSWDGEKDTLAPCDIVHGCTFSFNTYFDFRNSLD